VFIRTAADVLDSPVGSFTMDREGVESEANRLIQKHLTKEQRKAIGRLSSEWGVLDSTERLICKLMAKHYETERLQPGVKRPPELAELESQQWKIFGRKREVSAELIELDEGVRPRRRQPGRKGNPFVQLRNAFIRASNHRHDEDICRELDFELTQKEGMLPVGLPESWVEKYGVRSYYEAYQHPKCRVLIQKLISAAKASS
jgi:hypothetical protein